MTATCEIPLIPLLRGASLAAWPTRVKDFAAFIAATGYDAAGGMLTLGKDDVDWLPQGHTWASPGFAQTPEDPVVGVSYHDALAFCAWLTVRDRAADRIKNHQIYSLPTDREWSVAIGLPEEEGDSPEARLFHSAGTYPWGTSLAAACRFRQLRR